jgi:hypothetical protein
MRDPVGRRELWLGVDVGGVALPASLGLFDRSVWVVRSELHAALALTPWLALSGRAGLVWYDADNVRTRFHDHALELSGQPLARGSHPRLQDRLSFGVEFHALRVSEVDGQSFDIGGVNDVVVRGGYGAAHRVAPRWWIEWQGHARYVWLFEDTQRQLRGGLGLQFTPAPGHTLVADAVAFVIHRDASQFGNPLPRWSLVAQAHLGYAYFSRLGLGPYAELRATSAFLSGEAPVYEVREEALNAPYADATLGLRWRWR